MAQVRNVSDTPRFVPSLQATVGVDEVLFVPDEGFDPDTWPLETWEVVSATTTDEEK